MKGIEQNILFYITRLKAVFSDELNEPITILATAFWVSNKKGEKIFITNKHNIDPTLKKGDDTLFKLKSLYIELRKQINENGKSRITYETKFFEVRNPIDELKVSDTADCAIIVDPEFIDLSM